MICERCGEEILPGQLLCPKCGWEVRMVPDFEAVVDTAVVDAMEDIADHIAKTQEEEEEELRTEAEENFSYKVHLHSSVLTFFVVGVVFIIILFKTQLTMPKDPIAEAGTLYEKGDYSGAAAYFEDYLKDNPEDTDTRLLLADSYTKTGRVGDAISIYSAFSFDNEDDHSVKAVKGLIDIYIDSEDYHSVNELLQTKAAASVLNEYMEYTAFTPEFSVAQDTYDQPVYVRIIYNGEGRVFYTMDGSAPDSTSTEYENPILLDKGVYTLKAVAVNNYGVMSDTATSIYEITSPGNVTVIPESGVLDTPGYIKVNAPEGCKVYYTTGGKEPTTESRQYKGLLVIPNGKSTFRFLCVMEDSGMEQEILREYELNYEGEITYDEAHSSLIFELMKNGVILNPLGSVPGRFGQNMYSRTYTLSINSSYYYLFEEYYQDLFGEPQKTGELYCVDTQTGVVYRAIVDDGGHYSVVSF